MRVGGHDMFSNAIKNMEIDEGDWGVKNEGWGARHVQQCHQEHGDRSGGLGGSKMRVGGHDMFSNAMKSMEIGEGGLGGAGGGIGGQK